MQIPFSIDYKNSKVSGWCIILENSPFKVLATLDHEDFKQCIGDHLILEQKENGEVGFNFIDFDKGGELAELIKKEVWPKGK